MRTSTKKIPRNSYEFHPLETKIIFDSSDSREHLCIEIDDISEQLNEGQKKALFPMSKRTNKLRSKGGYVQILIMFQSRIAYEELRDMIDKRVIIKM